MKFFMFLAAAALIAGSIYHAEVMDYFASLSNGGFSFDGGSSVFHSMQSMGEKSSAALGKIGSAFGR